MDLSVYRCVVCERCQLHAYDAFWQCEHCGEKYKLIRGVPKLYLESRLGERDRLLRDSLYNGFLGRYYHYVMPFLALPMRPSYWSGWISYALILTALVSLAVYVAKVLFLVCNRFMPPLLDLIALLLFVGAICFLLRHKYLLYLLLLAIPVKISVAFTSFSSKLSFTEVHKRLIDRLLEKREKLRVLDIATGTGNSLYRHGWMKLEAEYTGLDLSEMMIFQAVEFMARKQVPMSFVLGDATCLPFDSEIFDVVLNYGALNGYSDPKSALEEMARVAKRGGLVLFLDEELYESASLVEKIYFQRVLSSHNLVQRCPVELIPENLSDISVHQVYHFYYLCSCYKR